jgi:hypothetical protein
MVIAMSSGGTQEAIVTNQLKEEAMHENVVELHPTALATVVGLPYAYDPGEDGRWQAMLRLRRYVSELEPLEQTVISLLFGLYGPDKSVGEVARQLRMTPEGVVRVEERALAELRRKCGTKPAFLEAA